MTLDNNAPTEPESPEKDKPQVVALPALNAYLRTYAKSCGNNDQKAVKIFKEYESAEKVRRLKGELMAIQAGKVSDEVCIRILGKNRQAKLGTFPKWATMVIAALNSAR